MKADRLDGSEGTPNVTGKRVRILTWTLVVSAICLGVVGGLWLELTAQRSTERHVRISDSAIRALFPNNRLEIPRDLEGFLEPTGTFVVIAAGACEDCNRIAGLRSTDSSADIKTLFVFDEKAGSTEKEVKVGKGVEVIYRDLFTLRQRQHTPFALLVNRYGRILEARQLVLPRRDLANTSDIVGYMREKI